MKKISFTISISLLIISFILSAMAQQTVRLQTVMSGLTNPLFVTNAKDGTKRLFVLEQAGVIKVLNPGATTPTVFYEHFLDHCFRW